MAVNGIEIVHGSEWVTKDGKVGTIWGIDDSEYCWRFYFNGNHSYTYNNEGEYVTGDKNSEDLSHPVNNTLTDDQKYTVDEIKKAISSLEWGNFDRLTNQLEKNKDPEYAEYLRLKNKFEIKDKN